jgi:hypothetical protein
MSYNAITSMASSPTLRARLTAAAAEQGYDNPDQWLSVHMWALASSPGWADKWVSAAGSMTVNQNPDLGVRDDVITDGDILAAVQGIGP